MTPLDPGGPTEAVSFSGPEVCRLVGCSYRMLDNWARTGRLVPSIEDAHGSGTQRAYSADDLQVAAALSALSDAGISGPRGGRRENAALLVVETVTRAVRRRGLIGTVEVGLLTIDLSLIPDPIETLAVAV